MDAELIQLAREAVTALQVQAAGHTNWAEIAQIAISGGGLFAILVGLKRMGEAGTRRDREIDELGKGLQQQGEMMTEALQALRQQGQALFSGAAGRRSRKKAPGAPRGPTTRGNGSAAGGARRGPPAGTEAC